MCDTKFSIYLYSVRFGIRTCPCSLVVSWVFCVTSILASVSGTSSFSRRVTSTFSVNFVIADEPSSSGVGPEAQEAIKQAFSDISANLSTVIESRLAEFKRDLFDERDSSVSAVVERVKRNEVEFKSKGQQQRIQASTASSLLPLGG